MIRIYLISALLLCGGISLPQAHAAPNLDTMGQEVNALFEKARPSIVRVRSEADQVSLAGTGFFIDNQGTILTSSALLLENGTATIQTDSGWEKAQVIGRDPRSGVAVLKINRTGTPFLNLGNSKELKTGLAVVAVGYPRNLPAAPTFGLVSGFDFRYNNRFFSTTHICATLPVSPGQVGGPLLNTKGEVVGLLITAIDEGRSIYALPIEAAEKVMTDFKQFGLAKHGWVGVGVKETPVASGGTGVQISELFDNTPARTSGLLPGDRVLKIDSRPINCPADVLDASFYSKVGSETSVSVDRGGKTLVYKFIVQERPTTMPTVAQDYSDSSKNQPANAGQSARAGVQNARR